MKCVPTWGVERAQLDRYWDEKEQDRYIGRISFTDSLLYVCGKCGKPVDDPTFPAIIEKRITTKFRCFEHVAPEECLLQGFKKLYYGF